MKNNRDIATAVGVGFGAGLVLGAVAAFWYQGQKTVDADSILENVRNAFLKEGPIEGSWIQFDKKPVQKFAIKTKTYTGGITRIEDGVVVQYEFVADAYTGSVLEIYRLNS